MIKCIFEDRLELMDGHIVRIVEAKWAGNRRRGIEEGQMDVFRQYDDGREEVRNLAFSSMGGYFLYDTAQESWSKPCIDVKALKVQDISQNKVFTNVSAYERNCIEERYPGFRWFMAKILDHRPSTTCAEAFDFLKAWLLWPECERLFNGGYYKLCTSRSFAQATYREQMRICTYLKQHPDIQDPGLGEIRTIMKNGWTQDEYDVVKHCRIDNEMLRYLKRQLRLGTIFREDYSLEALYGIYQEYWRMAKDCGHDMENAYWKYPSDMREAHDKVMKECKNTEAARLKAKQKKYARAVKKFVGKVFKDGAIEVYVPGDVNDISEQASVLHQCLVTADYFGKVADRECILVFVRSAGKPLATAEIDRRGKVCQFYADESDRTNMKPGKKAQEALDAWLKKFKPRWRVAA